MVICLHSGMWLYRFYVQITHKISEILKCNFACDFFLPIDYRGLRTHISAAPALADRLLTTSATWEALPYLALS